MMRSSASRSTKRCASYGSRSRRQSWPALYALRSIHQGRPPRSMAHSVIARRRALVFVFLALSGTPRTVCAQGGFLWQGIVDVEAWKTDSASNLLARGSGHPSLLGRIDTWAAAEPLRNIVFFAEVLSETGPARIEAGSAVYFKPGGVRFSPSDAFPLQGGKNAQIRGDIYTGQLFTVNPPIATA